MILVEMRASLPQYLDTTTGDVHSPSAMRIE